MKVKLYSTVVKNETQVFDPVSGKVHLLSPEAKPEELLGEFNAHEETAPNGSKWTVVSTPHGDIHFEADETTKATQVNVFRIESVE